MSKKYGRQFLKAVSKPDTNPPEGFVEFFADADNGGKITTLLATGESTPVGSGAAVPYSDTDPLSDGVAAQGVSEKVSRQDHVHPSDTSREPIFSKNTAFNKNFGTSAGSVCEGNDTRLTDARTPIAHTHSASEVTSGALDGARIPVLDASKIGSGVFDIARIPASALERLVQVASQAARFLLTTATVQLGDTVKQLDTGIMYVVVDVANLNNATGYMEYTAASAASVPWSGVTSKPTTLSGYGITDASPSSHVGATGSAHGVVTTSVNGFMSSTDKTKLDGVASGATAYSDSLARTACVAQTITNGVTTSAPSQDAVFDSLALKANVASPTFTGTATSASFASTVATGTAPIAIVSTTAVANLNADLLDGNHASAFATSGHTHLYAGSASAGGAANSVASSHSPGTGLSGSAYNGSAAQTWDVVYGSAANTACQGNDSRLSDARTPTAHTHGNITNTGAIGSTAKLPIITTTSGVLTTGSFGVGSGSFCEGNDARLSNPRPASDVAPWAKAASKPSYTAVEVGAAPASHAANASTYGYGDTTNAGHLRVGSGLAVTTGTVRANINDAGKAATELISAQAIDNICCAISRASYMSGIVSEYDAPALDINIASAAVAESLAVSHDGTTLAIGNSGLVTYKLDSASRRYYKTANASRYSDNPILTYNGQKMVGRYSSTEVVTYLWDGANNRFSESTAVNSQPPHIARLAMSADGNFLVVVSNYTIAPFFWSYKWNTTAGRFELTASPDVAPAAGVNLISMSYTGNRLVLGNGTSYTWSSANNRYQITADPDSSMVATNNMCVSSDGSKVLIGVYAAPYVKSFTWSAANNRYQADAAILVSGVTTPVPRALSLSGDGSTLAIALATGGLIVCGWNVTNNRYEKITTPTDLTIGTTTGPQCAISGDGSILFIHHGTTTRQPNYLMLFKRSANNSIFNFYHTFDRSKMILPGVAYE